MELLHSDNCDGSEKNMKVGFVYQCYKNRLATDGVLQKIRVHYPKEPVYLISDCGGDDMPDIAAKYDCFYVISDKKIGNGVGVDIWLSNIQKAIDYCNTEYIVLLEDDVICNGKYTSLPVHAGGNHCNNDFRELRENNMNERLMKYVENLGVIPKFWFWSLAGGSIINCDVLKQCLSNGSSEKVFEAAKIYKALSDAGDCFLSFLLMINGFTCDHWTNTGKSNMVHPDKRFY